MKWATQESIDSSKFTHSTSSNAHQITVDSDGDYLLLYSDGLTSGIVRASPKMVIRVNGNDILGAETSTHYIRFHGGTTSHDYSSGALTTVLNGLKANDKISVGVKPEAVTGLVNDHVPARIVLLKNPPYLLQLLPLPRHQEHLLFQLVLLLNKMVPMFRSPDLLFRYYR